MFEKRKARRIIEGKMEKETPEIAALSLAKPIRGAKKKNMLAAIGATAGVAAVAVSAWYGIGKALGIGQNGYDLTGVELTHPADRVYAGTVSAESAAIYENYAHKLVPLIFAKENAASRAFSVFDSFVSVSMTVYCSSEEIQAEYCALLGAENMGEITQAVRELTLTLGVNSEYIDPSDGKTKTEGGASANSLWLAEDLPLADSSAAVLEGLQNDYFASIYHTAASTEKLAAWLRDSAPAGFDDLPQLRLDDEPETASVSAYFVKDSFSGENQTIYKNEYESRSHYLDYSLPDGSSKEVDFIFSKNDGPLLEGNGFTGVHSLIKKLGIDYFLPDEGKSPDGIMGDVINESYSPSSSLYDLQISAPYFLINTENLDFKDDLKEMAPLFQGPLMQKLIGNDELYLSAALQSSILQYDYSGFYAVSITVTATDTSSPEGPHYPPYIFTLDRPYVFEVSYPLDLEGDSKITELPLFYGEVIDPGYAAA
jgi:hypothetical protein